MKKPAFAFGQPGSRSGATAFLLSDPSILSVLYLGVEPDPFGDNGLPVKRTDFRREAHCFFVNWHPSDEEEPIFVRGWVRIRPSRRGLPQPYSWTCEEANPLEVLAKMDSSDWETRTSQRKR